MERIKAEWPLAAFSLLVQLGLGAVLLATLFSLAVGGGGAGDIGAVDVPAGGPVAVAATLNGSLLWTAALALLLGLLLSLFHLGTPLGGYRALLNLRSSWLSREILLAGLFTGLTLLAALWGNAPMALLLAATLTGIATLVAMSRMYQATVMPAWSTFFTPLSFFTATVTLGAASGAVATVSLGSLLPAEGTTLLLLWLSELTGLALIIQLGGHALYLRLLRQGEGAFREAHDLLTGPWAWVLAARLAAGLVGLALLAPSAGGPAVWLAAGALAGAEVLGRLLFYAAGIPIRVG